MSYYRDGMEDAIGPRWTKRVIGAFTVLAIYLAVAFFTSIWPFSVARDLAHNVVNAKSIQYNYEWYYDQFAAIQAQEANVRSVALDAVERSGMIMVLNNAISEYNSKSKQITRNLWKADDLPYQIEFFKP